MIGFNLSRIDNCKPSDMPLVDRMFCEVIKDVADWVRDADNHPLYVVKDKIQAFHDEVYLEGYEQGRIDEQGVSKKGGQ